ncbi:hypothetical protein LCGC14_1659690 [marine sediment metagenome]|uniref:Calcineurin-like phosphoesterase domain-containing protein n=1 Tax=marine sediment metagenome TaxID=412755 RepID=A0A0F9KAC3_9ZZZZ
MPICDEFIDIIEEGKIPFYTVWGNHEEEGHNFSLSKSTTLNHMFNRSLLIKLLTEIEKKNNKPNFFAGFFILTTDF